MYGSIRMNQGVFWHPLPKAGDEPVQGHKPIPKIDPLMGINYGLKAFVAAVLGGIGSIPGAVLGGLLIGTSEVMVVGYLSSTYRDAIAFGILILVLLIRPQGLLGRVQKEKV